MTVPHYGINTIARPQLVNVPDPPPGAVVTKCPYCWAQCWLTSIERRIAAILKALPAGYTFTSACTRCAFERHTGQARMDMERWQRENAEVCEAS